MVGELAAARLQLLRAARRCRRASRCGSPSSGASTHVSGLSARDPRGPRRPPCSTRCRTCAMPIPAPEIWPFVAALAVTFWLVWSIWSVPGFAVGIDPAGDRVHRLVLAQQEGAIEEVDLGEGAVSSGARSTPASVPRSAARRCARRRRTAELRLRSSQPHVVGQRRHDGDRRRRLRAS